VTQARFVGNKEEEEEEEEKEEEKEIEIEEEEEKEIEIEKHKEGEDQSTNWQQKISEIVISNHTDGVDSESLTQTLCSQLSGMDRREIDRVLLKLVCTSKEDWTAALTELKVQTGASPSSKFMQRFDSYAALESLVLVPTASPHANVAVAEMKDPRSQIRINDFVFEVNGTDVRSLSHAKLLAMIKMLGPPVELTFSRSW
jgi:hypothetical protein